MGDIETLVTQKSLKANNMMDNARKKKNSMVSPYCCKLIKRQKVESKINWFKIYKIYV